jgi:hypothetical protein
LYEFKLIFRGSRDGFTGEKFHKICDNKSRTVAIIKVKRNNEIIGGYNPVEWRSDYRKGITKDSFIFSFKNNEIENYILSRVKDEKLAITNGVCYGPSFGDADLIIKGKHFYNGSDSYCSKFSYENKISNFSPAVFSIEEYEIFQIIKP